MMGVLLFTEDEDLGALNLYSREPGAFTATSETAGWLLASHAAVAFFRARTHDQMEQAVATRHDIGEAMGILMSARNLTEEQAFDVLRRYPQEKNWLPYRARQGTTGQHWLRRTESSDGPRLLPSSRTEAWVSVVGCVHAARPGPGCSMPKTR